ncbi:ABC transporter substrate-binding protein [Thalassoroseus pseudoceratinae]|uniref:ABC transporter substrate-binding protein n=1 Tax=Thalassoroseus pseudoceratinae TaxID=2713176 RepID=UPI001421934F|nr:ABC transporter substrate-binding protein [Thalassoroseus pseudoceratinae]
MRWVWLSVFLWLFAFSGSVTFGQDDAPASDAESEKPNADDDEEKLPLYSEMKLPTAAEFLSETPKDWVHLETDEVIVSEPIYPRPDTIEELKRQQEKIKQERARTKQERADRAKRLEELEYVTIILPDGGEAPEFRLHPRHIQEIIHHEDLVLRRIDKLISEKNSKDAYNLLAHLDRRDPNWEGLQRRHDGVLLLEAKLKYEAGEPELALVYLEELFDRDPRFPNLKEQLGEATESLVKAAVDKDDFRKARHYVGRLHRLNPDHPVVKDWEADLQKQTSELFPAIEAKQEAGDYSQAVTLVEEAAQIWPRTPGLPALYGKLQSRWQRLTVGVRQLPGESPAYFLPTQADRRANYLKRLMLFELGRFEEQPQYGTRFFEQWEPTDLGRRIAFRLRPQMATWESREPVTAPRLADALSRRLDPQSSAYDERFADYVDSIRIRSPLEFEIALARVPLRIEPLFHFPLPASPIDEDREFLSRRFVEVERNENLVRYQRAVPQSDLPSDAYRVAEVVEKKYTDENEAVRDLVRGNLTMLAPTRHQDLNRLNATSEFVVVPMALLVTHVLQFNPLSKPLQRRELRRALAYSIGRPQILQDVFLAGADARHGRIVSAPFPSAHTAYNSLVEPRTQDLTLAVALRLAAKKAMKQELPKLKMICEPDANIRKAAEILVADWKRTGINVELIDPSQPVRQDSLDWDIVYRTASIADPLTELWPFVTLDEHVRVSSLKHLPDWLRREFLELDTVSDRQTALARLRRMHRLLQSEVLIIPLWEIDEFLAFRRDVQGFLPSPLTPYQNIEQWTIRRKLPAAWPD